MTWFVLSCMWMNIWYGWYNYVYDFSYFVCIFCLSLSCFTSSHRVAQNYFIQIVHSWSFLLLYVFFFVISIPFIFSVFLSVLLLIRRIKCTRGITQKLELYFCLFIFFLFRSSFSSIYSVSQSFLLPFFFFFYFYFNRKLFHYFVMCSWSEHLL